MKVPVVGQRLYSLNIGNAARNKEQKLVPVIVSKVGRKYFSTHPEGMDPKWHSTEYHLENWKEHTNYSANSCLYESEQAWIDEKEANELCRTIAETFKHWRNPGIPLETLRQIAALLP